MIFLIKIKYKINSRFFFYRVAVVDNHRNENLSLTKFVRTLLSTRPSAEYFTDSENGRNNNNKYIIFRTYRMRTFNTV